MTLAQFLSTLTSANVTVDLVDLNTSVVIASLLASSYSVLEDAIEAREVKQWSILSPTHIKAVIAPATPSVTTNEEEP